MISLKVDKSEIAKNAIVVAGMLAVVLLCGLHDWARFGWIKLQSCAGSRLHITPSESTKKHC
jgi:hypothetical protein